MATLADDQVQAGFRWIVLRSKPRQEKALGRSLDAAQIKYLLLLYASVKSYGHRRREVKVPLFPGYLFMWGSEDDRVTALETGRVVQTIHVADQLRLEGELRHIVRAIDGGATLDPYPFLDVGRRVRVKSGPFQGVEGLVDERKSVDRLIMIVEAVGRAVSLEIDASILEPIDR